MIVAADVAEIPLRVALIVSRPEQPLSRYDAVATPFTVVTDAVKSAFPVAEHPELKLTDRGVVNNDPSLRTWTLTLVVPNAESEPLPIPIVSGLLNETLVAPIANAVEPLAVSVPTWALASILAAPLDAVPEALRVTVATPLPSVSAVPDAGDKVAKLASVVNVTTTPPAALPSAFFTVAVTRTGLLLEIALFA